MYYLDDERLDISDAGSMDFENMCGSLGKTKRDAFVGSHRSCFLGKSGLWQFSPGPFDLEEHLKMEGRQVGR